MSTNTDIVHDHLANRFVLQVEGSGAVLEYRLSSAGEDHPGVIDFNYTYVPPEFRGKGLAERLVRRGLLWARTQGYEIQASCWYVRKFLRH